jgi:hypothetical protein
VQEDQEDEKKDKIWVISNKQNKFEVPILKRVIETPMEYKKGSKSAEINI